MRRLELLFVVAMTIASLRGEVNVDLLRAAKQGDAAAVKALLRQHGTEIADANSGVAAFKAAAEQGHAETVRVLLTSPVLDLEKAAGQAVIDATRAGFIEIVRVIIKTSSDTGLKNSALTAAVLSNNIDLARVLLAEGAHPEVKPVKGSSQPEVTFLAVAAGGGAIEMVELLLDWGADANQATKNGGTPLMAAANNGRVEVLRVLVGAGAEVNVADNDGRTALGFAAMERRDECVRFLISSGANLEQRDTGGRTVLMNVAGSAQTSMMHLLLEWDVDIDASDPKGMTALMIAAASGRLDNVKALLAAEPEIKAQDKEGRTATDHARAGKREDIAEAIETARRR